MNSESDEHAVAFAKAINPSCWRDLLGTNEGGDTYIMSLVHAEPEGPTDERHIDFLVAYHQQTPRSQKQFLLGSIWDASREENRLLLRTLQTFLVFEQDPEVLGEVAFRYLIAAQQRWGTEDLSWAAHVTERARWSDSQGYFEQAGALGASILSVGDERLWPVASQLWQTLVEADSRCDLIERSQGLTQFRADFLAACLELECSGQILIDQMPIVEALANAIAAMGRGAQHDGISRVRRFVNPPRSEQVEVIETWTRQEFRDRIITVLGSIKLGGAQVQALVKRAMSAWMD